MTSCRHGRYIKDEVPAEASYFLRRHAGKSHEAGGAKTFLAIDDKDGKTVLAFNSLSPASVEYARTPGIVKRGLGRYDVPGFRLARLAVAKPFQGQSLGGQLLLAAGRRCIRAATEVGGVLLVIDAKKESVAKWCAGYGAVPLNEAPLTLLPLATTAQALQATGHEKQFATPFSALAAKGARLEGGVPGLASLSPIPAALLRFAPGALSPSSSAAHFLAPSLTGPAK